MPLSRQLYHLRKNHFELADTDFSCIALPVELSAGQPLMGELIGYRKLKIFSDFRVVFRVKKREVVVLILAVGMRRNFAAYESAVRRLKEQEE